ncbi:hypothetical protein KGA66_02325 [Actinocrinis puniceicyclus]|uniref:NPCBM/NEW2 domain-containing protein n=1 Tax=Actinocrinis puniceicyclus TaxID=977794 RepID=A0A8J8B9I2_9ACTN|nr:hypothetical protein [Actinocrinis puniceicyclus]MBS2961867.1 hypothetical protein [Actinocrinis puniceicyclus]
MSGQSNPRPRGERGEPLEEPEQETAALPTVEGEIVPHEEHSGIDVRIPGPVERAPTKTIPVPRKTALWVLLTLVLLLALVAGLLYALLKHTSPKAAEAGATGSPSASATATAPSASPSPSAALSPTEPAGGPSPTASGEATSGASPQSTASSAPNPAFSPVNGVAYLGTPVDGSNNVDTKTDVVISGTDYPYSSRFNCPSYSAIDWNVAGYSVFTATLGIPDNASGATGATVTMTFSDQNGKVLSVNKTAIGQPAVVRIPLSGVDRLIVSCNRSANNGSNYNYVALGNGAVS